jgi:membrane fusion protein, multidrug efflux system
LERDILSTSRETTGSLSGRSTKEVDVGTHTRRTLNWVRSEPIFHALMAVAIVAWIVAVHWERWTGAHRYQRTDGAYMVGDVTPLAAEASGYIKSVAVNDYQSVRRGDLIVEVDPSDYQALLDLAEANAPPYSSHPFCLSKETSGLLPGLNRCFRR